MVKYLLHIPELDDVLEEIIKKVHSVNQVTATGTEIEKKKNLTKMYPKYIYPLHLILRGIKHNSEAYQKEGVGISHNELAKRICEDNPTTTLILNSLQDYGIIVKVKNYSNNKYSRKASKYKLGERYVELFNQTNEKHLKVFTREEHGKMIGKLVENDTKYQQQIQNHRKEVKELYQLNQQMKEAISKPIQPEPVKNELLEKLYMAKCKIYNGKNLLMMMDGELFDMMIRGKMEKEEYNKLKTTLPLFLQSKAA